MQHRATTYRISVAGFKIANVSVLTVGRLAKDAKKKKDIAETKGCGIVPATYVMCARNFYVLKIGSAISVNKKKKK